MLIESESLYINRATLSTVAEVISFTICFVTGWVTKGVLMHISGQPAEANLLADARNLVTTASATHLL